MEIAITLLLFCFLILQFILYLSILNVENEKKVNLSESNLPQISILIAARNESENIISCLKAIELIDYPKNKLEILIGNDQSTDNTNELIEEFISNKDYYKQIQIKENKGNAKAKANVLGHLFDKCNGEIVFITDADITVKPSWIKSILPYFNNKKVGIVSGTTIVNGKNLFGKMQSIDWLYFSGLLFAFNNIGLKSTAVGNNMAVSKNAYNDTAGYFNFEFSVTEDLTLFKAITNKGYSAISLMSPKNLNFSKAQTNFKSFLHQRKRWLIGAKGLNFKWKTILFLFSLFYPLLIFLSFYSLKNVVIIWLCKVVLQSVLVIVISKKLKNKINFFYLFCFEFYSIVSTLLISIFYLIPIKMEWKNRKF